jgi:hypothetical protein
MHVSADMDRVSAIGWISRTQPMPEWKKNNQILKTKKIDNSEIFLGLDAYADSEQPFANQLHEQLARNSVSCQTVLT